jgi:hypothetical protein
VLSANVVLASHLDQGLDCLGVGHTNQSVT